MHKKKIMILAVVLLMTAFFIGCAKDTPAQTAETSEAEQAVQTQTPEGTEEPTSDKPEATPEPPSEEVHVGLIYSGTGYETETVKNAVRTLMAMSSLKLPVTEMEADAQNPMQPINTLIEDGCEIIFTCGIGGKYAIEAAKENPDVYFEIYEGYEAGDLPNVSAFYVRMYQQQYLNGMIAGFISQSGNIGYLSQSAENTEIRRVNAFALGAKAANPEAVVHFAWMGEGSGEGDDGTAAALCDKNCDVIFSAEPDGNLRAMAEENRILLICPKNAGPDSAIPMIEPRIFSYVFDKARRVAQNSYKSNDIIEGWVGMEAYEIDFDKYPNLSGEQKSDVQDAASKMAINEWDVFTGPIKDKYGQTIIPAGVMIPDEDLLKMLWYVGNIQAMPPPMG